jgi:hypothetical protein
VAGRVLQTDVLNALTWREIYSADLKNTFYLWSPGEGESKCLLIDFKCSSMSVSFVFMYMRNFFHRHICTTRHCFAAIRRVKGSTTFLCDVRHWDHKDSLLNPSENDSEVILINYTGRAQLCGRTLLFSCAYVENEFFLDYLEFGGCKALRNFGNYQSTWRHVLEDLHLNQEVLWKCSVHLYGGNKKFIYNCCW